MMLLSSICLVAGLAIAQESPITIPIPTPGADTSAPGATYPYIAEITGNDVYVRSGPGTQHYPCGKCNTGDKVKVVGEQLGWSRIVPPAGSFSWVSMRYLCIDLKDRTQATVTGDRVRVYAGSESVEPLHSQIEQIRLTRGDKIKLLGHEKDDYCKIEPPAGAYLWVSTKFTRPTTGSGLSAPIPVVADANSPAPDANKPPVVVTPPAPSTEAKQLDAYKLLEARIDAEKAKPIEQQNYASIKKDLTSIANDKDAGRAATRAGFALEQIERFELAVRAARELGQQTDELTEILDRIDSAKTARLETVKDMSRFAAIGYFEKSNIYGPESSMKQYRIVDETGKTICYAMAVDAAAGRDLSAFLKKKVGLMGKITASSTTGGALIKFTDIEEINP